MSGLEAVSEVEPANEEQDLRDRGEIIGDVGGPQLAVRIELEALVDEDRDVEGEEDVVKRAEVSAERLQRDRGEQDHEDDLGERVDDALEERDVEELHHLLDRPGWRAGRRGGGGRMCACDISVGSGEGAPDRLGLLDLVLAPRIEVVRLDVQDTQEGEAELQQHQLERCEMVEAHAAALRRAPFPPIIEDALPSGGRYIDVVEGAR